MCVYVEGFCYVCLHLVVCGFVCVCVCVPCLCVWDFVCMCVCISVYIYALGILSVKNAAACMGLPDNPTLC